MNTIDRFIQPTSDNVPVYDEDGNIVGSATITETTPFVKRDTQPDKPITVDIRVEADDSRRNPESID